MNCKMDDIQVCNSTATSLSLKIRTFLPLQTGKLFCNSFTKLLEAVLLYVITMSNLITHRPQN